VAVRIENTFQVKEPVDRVWALLSDPRKVVTCVPGAQLTETVDERTFKGTVSVKVGPSVTDYKGQVTIERLDAQTHEIEMVGKGQDIRGKGSASLRMTGSVRALPDGGAEVSTVSEVTVVGLLAQLGSRMIQDVSAVMFKEFVKRFQEQIEQGPAAPVADASAKPEPVKAVSVLGSALGEAVRRTFHRKPDKPDES
jgi:carbon monoxide dehydrogenase subunit G